MFGMEWVRLEGRGSAHWREPHNDGCLTFSSFETRSYGALLRMRVLEPLTRIVDPLTWRAWLGSHRATAATEFALTVPVLLLFIGGVVEFGRIFEAYSVTNRLATQYAIAWADCSDVNQYCGNTEISYYSGTNKSAIANVAPQLVSSQVTLQMFQISMNGTTPTIVYAYPTGATLSAAQTTAAQAAFSNGQSGVLVTATYTHSLVYFSTVMTKYLGHYLTPSYTVTQLKS